MCVRCHETLQVITNEKTPIITMRANSTYSNYTSTTFTAFAPFESCSTSNSTAWPSFRDLKPSLCMDE